MQLNCVILGNSTFITCDQQVRAQYIDLPYSKWLQNKYRFWNIDFFIAKQDNACHLRFENDIVPNVARILPPVQYSALIIVDMWSKVLPVVKQQLRVINTTRTT